MRPWIVFVLMVICPASSYADDTISFEQFLNAALGQNLDLKADAAATEAASDAAGGFGLPAPMVGLTQMKDQSGSAGNFEVSQTIPFPTKMTSGHSARKFEAESKNATKRAREIETVANAKLLYFRLWKASQRALLLEEKRSAIEQHLKLAQATTRSDSFLKIHLIKAEGDLDLLENEVTQSAQNLRERQIEAAQFLDRDPREFKPLASEIPISALPKKEDLGKPHQLEAQQFELEALKSKESEARTTWFPEFNLRYREMGGTPMMPRYSETMVGVTLPFVFFWESKAVSGRASAERLQGEFLFAKGRREIEGQRELLFSKAESLKKQLDQFKGRLIPRAEKRVRLVHNVAPRDMETLQDHRETMEALPDLKLKALELREQYESVVAELNKYASGERK